jgi:single-strand DNA-binding protein
MFNEATLIGYVGKKPESRTLPNGRAVTSFSLATSERWKDKESGEQREQTEWHSCQAFGRQAEIVAQFVNKGDLLMVQGRIQTRKWQDKEGNDRYTTEIQVQNVRLMPNKREVEGGDSNPNENF